MDNSDNNGKNYNGYNFNKNDSNGNSNMNGNNNGSNGGNSSNNGYGNLGNNSSGSNFGNGYGNGNNPNYNTNSNNNPNGNPNGGFYNNFGNNSNGNNSNGYVNNNHQNSPYNRNQNSHNYPNNYPNQDFNISINFQNGLQTMNSQNPAEFEYERNKAERMNAGIAYLLWLPSLLGVAGLQRFYMGKWVSGLVYLLTGGLVGFGTIYDAITMPAQIEEIKRRKGVYNYPPGIAPGMQSGMQSAHIPYNTGYMQNRQQSQDFSNQHLSNSEVDKIIFDIAKRSGGVIVLPELCLKINKPINEIEIYLDDLTKRGVISLNITRDGKKVYCVDEFLSPSIKSTFEF